MVQWQQLAKSIQAERIDLFALCVCVMILDILFSDDSAPIQIQDVRMTSVYPKKNADVSPEIVIHFYNKGQLNMPLARIFTITTTND